MQPISFVALSAEAAVSQIRARLGPEAVVLNVRPLPVNGIARLWQKPLIEVLACLPDAPPPPAPLVQTVPAPPPITDVLAEFRQELRDIRQQVKSRNLSSEVDAFESNADSRGVTRENALESAPEEPNLDSGEWHLGGMLRRTGLLPRHAQSILDQVRAEHGETPPPTLGEEIHLLRALMARLWRPSPPLASNSTHVLVGPSGAGKTTCLCKWLTQSVLVEGRLAKVWRLDGATANMAESLSVYCDILGIAGERCWAGGPLAEDLGFIDLPGVDWRQPIALKELASQLKQYGSPSTHLVLNGAYDIEILLAQARAFSALRVDDLIITHLDEENRWGKLWNLALGTNYSIRYCSTGQNIPGDFWPATAELVLNRQFPRK